MIEYKDQYLYTIVILKPYLDGLKSELSKSRFVVRVYNRESEQSLLNDENKRAELEVEERELKVTIA